mmetsp:Transcript_7932/g.15437  ORF Transcript_7932/g.15437 Transcript_7932/m.15437 type:complete len:299 (+) Transcript_7932:491-1387(+)
MTISCLVNSVIDDKKIIRILMHCHATVNAENLTSDISGSRVERKKPNKASNLLRLTITTKGDTLQNSLLILFINGRSHVTGNKSRSNSVTSNGATSIFTGSSLSKTNNTSLGRTVVGLTRVAKDTYDAGNVHNTAPLLLAHDLRRKLGAKENAGKVNVNNLIPLLRLHAHHQGITRNSSIVDDNIKFTPLGSGGLVKSLNLLTLAHISLNNNGITTNLDDLLRNLICGLGTGGVVNNNLGSLSAKRKGNSLPNTTARTSDDTDRGVLGDSTSAYLTLRKRKRLCQYLLFSRNGDTSRF